MLSNIWKIPTEYERDLCIDVFDHLRDKNIIKMECTPFHFYAKVSPYLISEEGYSEFVVYLFSYILKGGWIDFYNRLATDPDKDPRDNFHEFHFCYEGVPENIRMKKFIPWLQEREKSGHKNLIARLKKVLVLDKFPESNIASLTIHDVFDIPPNELYKCWGIGKESIEMLKNHFMDVGLDWFHFHKYDPVRKRVIK